MKNITEVVRNILTYISGKTSPETYKYVTPLVVTGIYYLAIPFTGKKNFSIDITATVGVDSNLVVKTYMTNKAGENISTITIANWRDTSAGIIGAANWTVGGGVTDSVVWFGDTSLIASFHLLELNYTQNADSSVAVFVNVLY